MSKLYNKYLLLKKQNAQKIYLFKSGIFFIALDEDAQILSNIFNFKLSNLTDTIVKCGFPCSSYERYSKLFKACQLNVEIIQPNYDFLSSSPNNKQNKIVEELLNTIRSVDTENLSVSEAYKWIKNIKNTANQIF